MLRLMCPAQPLGYIPHCMSQLRINRVEAVKLLLDNGADVSSRTDRQLTPLHQAAQKGYDEVITTLVAAGANVLCENMDSTSPIDFAANNGHVLATSKLLLAAVTGRSANMISELETIDRDHQDLQPIDVWLKRSRCDMRVTDLLLKAAEQFVIGKGIRRVPLDSGHSVVIKLEKRSHKRHKGHIFQWSWKDRHRHPPGVQLGVSWLFEGMQHQVASREPQLIPSEVANEICRYIGTPSTEYLTSLSTLLETVVMKQLDHPNIVRVFGYSIVPFTDNANVRDLSVSVEDDRFVSGELGSDWGSFDSYDSTQYDDTEPSCTKGMVMEFMNGGNLNDWVEQHRVEGTEHCIDERMVRHLMRQALQALAYLHRPSHTDPFGRKNMSIVHHDIKPHNMLIHVGDDDVPVLKLSDFGLARFERCNLDTQPSDVYSWATSFVEVAPHLFSASTPSLTPQVEQLITKCREKDPTERPTAEALLAHEYFNDVVFEQWLNELRGLHI